MISTAVTREFPERASEINRLCHYLDPELVPSPPILLYGPSGKEVNSELFNGTDLLFLHLISSLPDIILSSSSHPTTTTTTTSSSSSSHPNTSGSGKTSVAISILDALQATDPHIPCAKILCSGFANNKQLFKAIYNAAATALFPSNNSQIFTAMRQRIQASGGMSAGIDTPSSSSSSSSSVLFSTIAATNKEEKRLRQQSKSKRISNISDLCHGLSDLMDLHSSNDENGTLAHSSRKKGPSRRRQQVRLHILLSSLSSADAYEKDLSIRLLNLAEMSSCPWIRVVAVTRICIGVPSCCIPLRFSAYTDTQLQRIIVFRGKQDLFSTHKKTSITCDSNSSCGANRGDDSYHGNHENYDSDSKDNDNNDDKIDKNNVQKKVSDFMSLVQDALPRLVSDTRHLNEIWSAVKILWQRQIEYMEELRRNTTSPHQQLSLSSIRAAEINSLQKRPVMNMCMDGQKDPRLMQFSSMRVDNWISSLPASTRFLLLATYIASKNPSHTDHVTMGVGLKGKRRKTIKGHTDKEDNDVETSILAQKGSLDVQKPIPLDRIFSM